jgi:hypothetical protein
MKGRRHRKEDKTYTQTLLVFGKQGFAIIRSRRAAKVFCKANYQSFCFVRSILVFPTKKRRKVGLWSSERRLGGKGKSKNDRKATEQQIDKDNRARRGDTEQIFNTYSRYTISKNSCRNVWVQSINTSVKIHLSDTADIRPLSPSPTTALIFANRKMAKLTP